MTHLRRGIFDDRGGHAHDLRCNGDVCIYLGDPSHGKVYVKGWAYNRKFYGHLQLTGPNGLNKTSRDGWYYPGGWGPSWTVPAVVGWYCITGWEGGPGHYQKNGKPCAQVE